MKHFHILFVFIEVQENVFIFMCLTPNDEYKISYWGNQRSRKFDLNVSADVHFLHFGELNSNIISSFNYALRELSIYFTVLKEYQIPTSVII